MEQNFKIEKKIEKKNLKGRILVDEEKSKMLPRKDLFFCRPFVTGGSLPLLVIGTTRKLGCKHNPHVEKSAKIRKKIVSKKKIVLNSNFINI